MRLAASSLVISLALVSAAPAQAKPGRWIAPVAGGITAFGAHATGLVNKGQGLVLAGSVALGVGVTRKLHQSTGFWAKRIPGTRMRMADLPVGGTLAFGAALLTKGQHPELSHLLAVAGAGMTIGAVGTGLADPLPKK